LADNSLVGKTIGNYTVTKLLGRGGMGAVYLAENNKISLQVAIKVLGEMVVVNQQLRERFQAEASAIARINHPNVIKIFDFGCTDDGTLYYVMEKLEGREFKEIQLASGQMSAKQIMPFLEQICAGLQAAHDQGVIHRDLKPENIFVLDTQPLSLKVLDFGIAKVMQGGQEEGAGLTSTGMVMGTPLYISPEQAAGRPDEICAQTDIYSLGVMVYQMLAGVPPFTADSTPQLLTKHILEVPPPLLTVNPGVSPAVAEVVERCMEKSPADRLGSPLELLQALSSALEADWQGSTTAGPSKGKAVAADPMTDAMGVAPTMVPAKALAAMPRQHSTMSSASGEMDPNLVLTDKVIKPARPVWFWLPAVAALLLGAAAGLVFFMGRAGRGTLPDQGDEPRGPAATAAQQGLIPQAAEAGPEAEAPDQGAASPAPDAAPDQGKKGRAMRRKARAVEKIILPAKPKPVPEPVAKPVPVLAPKPVPEPKTAPALKPAPEPKTAPKPTPTPKPAPPPKPEPKAPPAAEEKKPRPKKWIIDPFQK